MIILKIHQVHHTPKRASAAEQLLQNGACRNAGHAGISPCFTRILDSSSKSASRLIRLVFWFFLKNAGSDQIAGGSKLTLEKAILDHTSTDHDPHLIQSAPAACPGRRGLILQHKNWRTPKSTRGHFLLWALSECLGKCVAYLCISNFAVHVLSKNIACNELQRTKEAKACKS